MKKLFYIGFIGLLLFEIANIYFIMPMPGSQQSNTVDLAYFLYKFRWGFRILFGALLIIGLLKAKWKRKWSVAIPLIILAVVAYMANFKMAADAMFKQPGKITMATAVQNKVDEDRLVIGIVDNGNAKAYPIQFLGYHHFVYDTINGKNILVTYCTVCRTGRIFDPTVNGKLEKFRLVGMDHFNAMIEDAGTKSWWQQATGEAVAGKLKGEKLNEVRSMQTTLRQWLTLYPNATIMQADEASISHYDTAFKYESGASKSKLTGTDSISGQKKSWVIGVKSKDGTTNFDWNDLKKNRVLTGKIGSTNNFVVLANDGKSFFAFENNFAAPPTLNEDTILLNEKKYRINGTGIDTTFDLKPLNAYQEFLHSWNQFSKK